MIKVGICGITGYAGVELVKLINSHPNCKLIAGFSRVAPEVGATTRLLQGGQPLPMYPLSEIAQFDEPIDILLLATPPEISIEIIKSVDTLKIKVIDLSGACRLPQKELSDWYGIDNPLKALANGAHYGLSPWNIKEAKAQSIIANPGCYPTAALMSLLPLLVSDILNPENIIIDAKSGTSGAGKSGQGHLSFTEMADNFFPYKVGKHQHIPEIKNALCQFGKKSCGINFITQMLPLKRGIAMTIYADASSEYGSDIDVLTAAEEAYQTAYEDYPLVVINQISSTADSADQYWLSLKNVVDTPKTHINYYVENGKVILFVFIDNLLKGAASQAVENINALYSLPLHTGLLSLGELS